MRAAQRAIAGKPFYASILMNKLNSFFFCHFAPAYTRAHFFEKSGFLLDLHLVAQYLS
jgi:hypothetical protein